MEHKISHSIRVAIVGAGNVGATFAYALMQSGLAAEIVLIDANQAKAEGEVMDLNHAVPFASRPSRIWAGTYADCAGAVMTVVTAGAAQKPGETRLDLLSRNINIFRQIIPNIVQHNPDGLILIATNPVDILAYAAWKISGLPAHHVIGSGTILDTARFRHLLSQHFGVDPRSVHAYIIGEHGDSEVPVLSLANIAGMRLPEFCDANNQSCPDDILNAIFEQTRSAAYEIISRKGATYYAIASGLVRIVEAVVRDQNTVLSVSSHIDGLYGIKDVYLSLPAVLDGGGVERVLSLDLNPVEIQGLQRSAGILNDLIDQLNLR
ncbi:MAG TPA: L-lactate dehydrogenase [Anaerolineaceae bacterium]|nr:L-lactate dehydrogenase [Anaerolineaceae bacterium]HPN50618.1 L-lactate dehydrogenase [Anaerolineaceae bacterium]